jgi:predicted KAP-like P-loop ATPase
MQIRHTKLEIPPDDPFKNDALGRRDLEPPLTQFVTQASGSFVLALDASWGSGKTTFLEMWQVKLSEAGHACLYLNAWQNDFAQDPLIAIIGELTKAIEDFADQSGEIGIDLKKQMEKTRQFAQSLLKRLLPVGIKIATHGLLDIKEAAIEKAIADATSSGGEDLIKNYEKGKSEIKEFRKALGDLANQVASLNPSAKVVIIIDELDRCRPIICDRTLGTGKTSI